MAKSSNDASVNNENKSYIFTSYVTRDKDRAESLIKKLEEYYEIRSAEASKNAKNDLEKCSAFIAFISHYSLASNDCLDLISSAKNKNKDSLMIYLEDHLAIPEGMETKLSGNKLVFLPTDSEDSIVDQIRSTYFKNCLKQTGITDGGGGYDVEIDESDFPILESVGQFVTTLENEELFRQSELLYAQWLFNKDGKVSLSIVKKAAKLCHQSADMGNPKALSRLAYYYDKNYIPVRSKNKTEENELLRFKIAYNYYTAVCFSGMTEVETRPGCAPLAWREVRENTARALLRMLFHAPEALQKDDTFNFRTNLEKVQMKLGNIENIVH